MLAGSAEVSVTRNGEGLSVMCARAFRLGHFTFGELLAENRVTQSQPYHL